MFQGRFVRRALLRAGVGAAFGALVPRHRAGAALGAAATGAAIESPIVGGVLAVAALGTRDPAGLVAGAAIGAATTSVWPTAPRTVEELRRHGTKRHVSPSTDGAGIVVVVNAGAGSRASDEQDTATTIRERLPAAVILEPDEDADLDDVFQQAAAKATVAIGAAGGDGTLSAAAAVAHDADLPLLAVPAGTLNHFARDLGLVAVDDALDAVIAGEVVDVDLACVDRRTFLNTASFGAYTDLVDARERLEDRIGKWPAVAVALVRVLRRADPIELTIDGRRRRLWLGFVGSGRYQPSGFAPTWREVLDDGLLDVRLVDAAPPLARIRLVLSLLTGRLGRSTVYEQRVTRSLRLRSEDGDIRMALDGEVVDVAADVEVTTRTTPLRVYAPHR